MCRISGFLKEGSAFCFFKVFWSAVTCGSVCFSGRKFGRMLAQGSRPFFASGLCVTRFCVYGFCWVLVHDAHVKVRVHVRVFLHVHVRVLMFLVDVDVLVRWWMT